MSEPQVGDKVIVTPNGYVGVIKYIGPTRFKAGRWVGINLEAADGKHDGTINNHRYFSAAPGHGIFVRPENVSAYSADKVPRKAKAAKKKKKRVAGSMEFDPNTLVLGTAHEDLFKAAKDYENFGYLQALVEEDKVSATGTDDVGNTVLHAVAEFGGGAKAVAQLGYLLDHGLRPYIHARNIYGQTAVMLAAKERKWDCMEYLITEGADVISKGQSDSLMSVWEHCQNKPAGEHALAKGMAVARQRRENGDFASVPVMKHSEKTMREALFRTASAGDLNYVRYIIEDRDVPVNLADSDGNTCLHWISNNAQRLPIIKYLVSQKAAINKTNSMEFTACHIAGRSRAWPVLEYLVSVGANVTKKNLEGKNVFMYAQATLIAKKHYADGIATKHANQEAQSADAEEEEAQEEEYEPEEEVNEEEDYQNEAEVEEDIRAAAEAPPSPVHAPPPVQQPASPRQAPPAPKPLSPRQTPASPRQPAKPRPLVVAGTFRGLVTGLKRDKKKSKHCSVEVNENCIKLSYKKGSFYNRETKEDSFIWSDQMGIQKVDAQTLVVDLDPERNVNLKISPCTADTLEEFIWKHIWKSVFEGSVREAKQLLNEYEEMCHSTGTSIEEKIREKTELENKKQALRREFEKFQKANDLGSADKKQKEMEAAANRGHDLQSEIVEINRRFGSIRQQGETLLETFSKMHEALDRRLQTERQRHQQFLDKEQFSKAVEIKADQERIEEQMQLVDQDKNRVLEVYERMKELEMQYSYLNEDDDEPHDHV